MTSLHENKVNKLAECNLLHDIINTTKHTKNLKIHYSPIIHEYVNTKKVRARFKFF